MFRESADSARPWLLGIATNLLRNERRAERRTLEALARLQPLLAMRYITTAGSRRSWPHIARGLRACWRRLDGDQRDVLLLYAWAELSYEEIATAVGIPVGTVRSRLSRARNFLSSGLTSAEEASAHGTDSREATG